MNGIYGMALVYESLIPVNNLEDTFLSVGTVTMQDSERELNLDFNETCSSCERAENGIVTFTTSLCCFEPGTFLEEYLAAGLSPSDLTYDFFAARLQDTYLTEVYTECVYCMDEVPIPLTLKSAQLLFQDGHFLDYSERISVFALKELAEAA